ncbi:ATP-dependent nuclease [Dyadobacter sp. OTU695]|uniref:ATP-dependent nuclease n=1 Tax=Dyadobacter sp. OTU695 TaxID=3043860 RepID=UPI00313EAD79
MIIIKSVEIHNFRSIVRFDPKLSPNHLNIIVGQNDIGKSNFLKALNLFFNGETEIGTPFRFSEDYSKFAPKRRKKAAEIKVILEFQTPNRFKDQEIIVWTKIWRQDGLFKDQIATRGESELSGRSGALQWVKKVKYKYVPAIRGTEYFNYLMGDLHDALSEINPAAFSEASENFVEGLKSQVESLVATISQELGYASQIGIPSDFKQLFSTLDFALDKSGQLISLNKRGDGIKAQHIPIILKFIAAHYKSITGRAIINPDTIWGFEEPENNMEMGNAFKLSQIFASFSRDLQIFINTHSPAFYSLAKSYVTETSLYLAKMADEESGTNLIRIPVDQIELFDQEMGILPIVSDYIKKEADKRIAAESRVAELSALRSNTKFLVLSEDEDLTYVQELFEMQGFDRGITEFISYHGRGNLMAAIQSSKVKLTDKPDLSDIIFHRDSDIYDGDEPDKDRIEYSLNQLNRSTTVRHTLFLTSGYDLEAYFINPQHIKALYPEFAESFIEDAIVTASQETRDKSLDKLYSQIEKYRMEAERNNESHKFSFANVIKKLQQLYDSNPERYRYGKTVLGKLTDKLSSGRSNVNLIQKSDQIIIPELRALLQVH